MEVYTCYESTTFDLVNMLQISYDDIYLYTILQKVNISVGLLQQRIDSL